MSEKKGSNSNDTDRRLLFIRHYAHETVFAENASRACQRVIKVVVASPTQGRDRKSSAYLGLYCRFLYSRNSPQSTPFVWTLEIHATLSYR
jgi:hypothetical protein